MRIYFSPEATVVIQDDARELVYHGDDEDFAFESGLTRPPLPEGMVAMEYRDGVLVYYDAKQNAFPLEGTVDAPELDAVLARISALQAARTLRLDREVALPMDRAFDAKAAATMRVVRIG